MEVGQVICCPTIAICTYTTYSSTKSLFSLNFQSILKLQTWFLTKLSKVKLNKIVPKHFVSKQISKTSFKTKTYFLLSYKKYLNVLNTFANS